MHRILVEEKRWIGETRFLHALNYCMLLPGPEAHQLAIYIGWLLHRTRGGIVAGTLFILPGLICLAILSWLYAVFGEVGFVQALFFGLKAAVLAIVLEAVVRVGRRALKSLGDGRPRSTGLRRDLLLRGAVSAHYCGRRIYRFPRSSLGVVVQGNQWARPEGRQRGKGPAAIDKAFDRDIPAHVRPSLPRLIKVA